MAISVFQAMVVQEDGEEIEGEGEGKREKEGEGEEDADGVVLRGGREQASDASWRALLGPLLQEVLPLLQKKVQMQQSSI